MGYPKDLGDYTEQELTGELARRAMLRASGVCDYCGRPGSEPPCRYAERHARAIGKVVATAGMWAVVDTDNYGGDYPDERFVENTEVGVTEAVALKIANYRNTEHGPDSKRYWRVVKLPYKLQPGFQP